MRETRASGNHDITTVVSENNIQGSVSVFAGLPKQPPAPENRRIRTKSNNNFSMPITKTK